MFERYSTSILGAFTVTFFLFLGMHFLVAPDNSNRSKKTKGMQIVMGVVRDPEHPTVKDRKPEIIKDFIEPFNMPKLTQKQTKTKMTKIGRLVPPTTTEKINPQGIGLSDGDIQPIRKFAPTYPRSLATRGIEGYVIVKFTVNKMGAVENIIILESTNRAFERPSIRAVGKYKYKPRVIDGVSVKVQGVMEKISFEIEKS